MPIRYYSGKTELEHITAVSNQEFAAMFPGVRGLKSDGFFVFIGSPKGHTATWNHAANKWERPTLPVHRAIQYKARPSRHKCDDRCMFARGRICECSCNGANHGRGTFACSPAELEAA